MSNSSFADQLGLVPSSTCSHGCSAQGGCATVAYYPYNSTAAFIMDRILFHMGINGPNLPPTSVWVIEALFRTPEHAARIDANLVKSCVMVGTDILKSFVGIEKKQNVAVHLGVVILGIEEYLNLQSFQSVEERQYGNMGLFSTVSSVARLG